MIDYKSKTHKDYHNVKALEKKFLKAYNNAIKLGLDVDLAYLNPEGKFEFRSQFGRDPISSGSVGRKGHLLANAIQEIGNINSANKGLSESTIRNVKKTFPTNYNVVLNLLKEYEGLSYDKSKLSPAMKKRIDTGKGSPLIERSSPLGKFYEKVVPEKVKASVNTKGAVKGIGGALTGAMFAYAGGSMWAQGRHGLDLALLVPEFATFGALPASEMAQQWRIRSDLEKKGLPFSERNKAMAKYNEAKGLLVDPVFGDLTMGGTMTDDEMEEALAVRGDEDKRMFEKKVSRGFIPGQGWGIKDTETYDEEALFNQGGPVVPRVAYKDGSNWLDKLSDDDVANLGRGWKRDYKMDPDVMDRIKQKQILDAQAANEAGFKHRSQYEDTGSFIPEYVQDVVKKGFGTEEGLKYIGSKAGEGALEGFEWFIHQIPHLMKELDKRGLTVRWTAKQLIKCKKHLEKNKGKMNWMELMYTPNWGEEFLGFKMNDLSKRTNAKT